MDAFESLVAMLLRRQGYWTTTSYKVGLTKEEKEAVGRPSAPRWEIDVLAYSGSRNEVLLVECKSYLGSVGVRMEDGELEPADRYKLFRDERLRRTVVKRLKRQLVAEGSCAKNLRSRLCLAAGNVARKDTEADIQREFTRRGWWLFGPSWIREQLLTRGETAYENDVAWVVSKILAGGKD